VTGKDNPANTADVTAIIGPRHSSLSGIVKILRSAESEIFIEPANFKHDEAPLGAT
jgi:hypothetical protein